MALENNPLSTAKKRYNEKKRHKNEMLHCYKLVLSRNESFQGKSMHSLSRGKTGQIKSDRWFVRKGKGR